MLAEEADLDHADLTELDHANTVFAQLLAAPKVTIETGKATNQALTAALAAADAFVKQELARAVELLRRKQPALYAALREAMRVDDAPAGAAPAPDKPAGGPG